MDVVVVLHGSRDREYLESVSSFSRAVGVRFAFKELSRPLVEEVVGDVYIVLFVGYGRDYEDAVARAGWSTPPLLEWPGFVELIRGLGPDLVVLHGNNEPRFLDEARRLGSLGLRVAFLEAEPLLSAELSLGCPGRVLPLVLTRGFIYRKIVNEVMSKCPSTEVMGPLFEQRAFIEYFREMLPWAITNSTRAQESIEKASGL